MGRRLTARTESIHLKPYYRKLEFKKKKLGENAETWLVVDKQLSHLQIFIKNVMFS